MWPRASNKQSRRKHNILPLSSHPHLQKTRRSNASQNDDDKTMLLAENIHFSLVTGAVRPRSPKTDTGRPPPTFSHFLCTVTFEITLHSSSLSVSWGGLYKADPGSINIGSPRARGRCLGGCCGAFGLKHGINVVILNQREFPHFPDTSTTLHERHGDKRCFPLAV